MRQHRDRIQVFGSSINLGQSYVGVSRAAQELRDSGCLESLENFGMTIEDFGDAERLVYNASIPLQPYQGLYQLVLSNSRAECQQLILGGDHSQSISTISALLKIRPNMGVVWVDAHGDINTPESSLSGCLHGMPIAKLLGLFKNEEFKDLHFARGVLKPEQIVLIGVRDLDHSEWEIIHQMGIKVFMRDEVRRYGAKEIIRLALQHLKNFQDIHVSFDIDVIDPDLAPTTGVPVEDGLDVQEVTILTRCLGESGRVRSLEIVEINPDLAANIADWNMVVELTNLILVNIFCPKSRYSFAGFIPTLRSLGLQYIEKSFS